MRRKILYVISLLLICVSFTRCQKEYGGYCTAAYNIRVGAICNDNTHTDETGQGACADHGGVKYWLCN
ncbi:MAG TPA: hypothetical protein VK207_07560 [Bacteroidales bacterium]|nr:hypothetical protein [Bacteroidales bacterium]